jgi:hypothetical protein
MTTGSLTLAQYPDGIVRLTCDKCGRSGQYRKATLVARYGADARLPDVRQQIAACDRRSMLDQCGVKFVELTPQPLRFQSRS